MAATGARRAARAKMNAMRARQVRRQDPSERLDSFAVRVEAKPLTCLHDYEDDALVSRARASPPPFAIPRATALKRFERPAKDTKFFPSCASPSNKRGSPRPSCLPQPITKATSAPTFIPQPAVKTFVSSSMSSVPSKSKLPSGETILRSSSADGNASMGARPFAALQNLASLVPLSSPFLWSGRRASSETPSTVGNRQ
ncbi:hypothetical protein BC826DRAFT_1108490 [Russula brevipes]|nr:hypothetical protein BC826DRAFT_1108490 [Russula brevipes]